MVVLTTAALRLHVLVFYRCTFYGQARDAFRLYVAVFSKALFSALYSSSYTLPLWVERGEELSIICIKVAVKGKGRDESAERSSLVYMMKNRGPTTEP